MVTLRLWQRLKAMCGPMPAELEASSPASLLGIVLGALRAVLNSFCSYRLPCCVTGTMSREVGAFAPFSLSAEPH